MAPFLPLHELPANSKSRKTYSRRNDSKESKPKTHMAFEPAVPLLGLYILMHVPKDRHIEVFSDVLLVKTKSWKLSTWLMKSWNVHTATFQVDQKKKKDNENLDTICVVMWDDIQHTLLGEKSKVQDSENTMLPFVYKKETKW